MGAPGNGRLLVFCLGKGRRSIAFLLVHQKDQNTIMKVAVSVVVEHYV